MSADKTLPVFAEWLEKQPKESRARLVKAHETAFQLIENESESVRNTSMERGLAIAVQLEPLHCDPQTLCAALLYPAFRKTTATKEMLSKLVEESILKLLIGTTRMEGIDSIQKSSEFNVQRNLIDNLRKMLLAIVDDIRIVLIKLAERLVALKYLRGQSAAEQTLVAKQVMDIYAPLANRLGIGQLKWQMEDWSFRYLNSEQYNTISKSLNRRRDDREKYIQEVLDKLQTALKEANIPYTEIAGRPKHIYSIYRKVNRKQVDVAQIYDTSAVRVLVPTIEDCYAALSLVHMTWAHIPQEFDDYIAKPKPNGYRSIHTAVIGPGDFPVEIQIRTSDMHAEAELGVAAHWKYKEGKKLAASYEEKILWLRDLMDWQKELTEETAKKPIYQKIFEDRVYVFTPQGDVLDLTVGATPLDFAYHIHTDVGHRCRGAKVNGTIVPLTHILKTGDRVEILTVKSGHPSRDWLNPTLGYLKSEQAKAKVRHYYHQENFQENMNAGLHLWEKTYTKAGFPKNALEKIFSQFNLKSVNDLLAAIGAGDIGIQTVINRLRTISPNKQEVLESALPIQKPSTVVRRDSGSYIGIEGVGNLLTQLARCCQPIPGDPIIGYITKGRGITIHQQSCFNIKQALKFRTHRIVAVDWGKELPKKYPVDLVIEADDRAGLLRDISNVVADEHITILGLTTHVDKLHNRAYINVTVEITNLSSLEKITQHLKKIPEILTVKRKR